MPLICLGLLAIIIAVLIDTPPARQADHDHPLTGDLS